MHDSLPKGDLDELLGVVNPHVYRRKTDEPPSLPTLPSDAAHPYHLIVVAGQECPSSSGIPMGLGAGFRLKENHTKEKDREKEKGDDKEPEKLQHHSRRKDKDRDEVVRGWKSSDDLQEELVVQQPASWTSILEHWLCHRSQAVPPANGDPTLTDVTVPPKRYSLHRRVTIKEQDKGPYVPLIKERMMGLYLAVYVHRDARDLVSGTSKSAVTAGLIGGRVGNKGGVGISLKIDGTTFLFLNAHLTAHEGKVHHRLANLAKIKAELAVDDFLDHDDPRFMAEDITDKFDFTFLCGDLNFRLDITRLHADWLISRQDYAQAFAFDQLKKQMEQGTAFSGFHEAPINFPPTFKYDVFRRSKSRAIRRHSKRGAEKDRDTTEAEAEAAGTTGDDEDAEDEGEALSLASSTWNSVQSKHMTEGDDERYFTTFGSSPAVNEGGRAALTTAAHKAKARWKALVAPSLSPPAAPVMKWLRKQNLVDVPVISREPPSSSIASVDMVVPEAPKKAVLLDPQDRAYLTPRPASRGMSVKSVPIHDASEEDGGRAVYDSSAKQRVPSWCDRILWKSTTTPDLEEIIQPDLLEVRSRTRVGTLLSQAFRPRLRRDSSGSLTSEDTPGLPTRPRASVPFVRAATDHGHDSQRPVSFNIPKSPNVLRHSRSIDTVPTQSMPDPPRASEHDVNHAVQRRLSLDLGLPDTGSSPTSPATKSETHDIPPPVPPKDSTPTPPASTRWGRFFPFRRDTSGSIVTTSESPHAPSGPPPPVRGDVVCLSYRSLDDREMRLLEGRSDHRPVIGSYAVYI
ncbi:DNase I-like protein [Rhizopogon vinicolor AM-OR11-026]|uniref:DNase I-like protein n=1 Tax=Rhizopogon vinicolor AM-OR11-026 TaxID=1314800 RepID=A0A1B7MYF4_9AGAM|nr:DNase I-like protein [Rhizopogon vinicolor AM-OR11-026]